MKKPSFTDKQFDAIINEIEQLNEYLGRDSGLINEKWNTLITFDYNGATYTMSKHATCQNPCFNEITKGNCFSPWGKPKKITLNTFKKNLREYCQNLKNIRKYELQYKGN